MITKLAGLEGTLMEGRKTIAKIDHPSDEAEKAVGVLELLGISKPVSIIDKFEERGLRPGKAVPGRGRFPGIRGPA
jgi:hypothetical protein